MSIEKLRAAIDVEISTCDDDHGTHEKHCDVCDRLLILRALLYEHESEHDQADLALRNARHDLARTLIRSYGEIDGR